MRSRQGPQPAASGHVRLYGYDACDCEPPGHDEGCTANPFEELTDDSEEVRWLKSEVRRLAAELDHMVD